MARIFIRSLVGRLLTYNNQLENVQKSVQFVQNVYAEEMQRKSSY